MSEPAAVSTGWIAMVLVAAATVPASGLSPPLHEVPRPEAARDERPRADRAGDDAGSSDFRIGDAGRSVPSGPVEGAATGRRQGSSSAMVEIPPIDFDRWARFIVRRTLEIRPYERVLLLMDPFYYPELVDALRAELMEVRAVEVGTILWDGARASRRRREVHPRDEDPKYKRLSDRAMRRLYEEADVFLWLPARDGFGEEEGDRRLHEHFVEETGTRGLHMHWVQNPDRFEPEEVEALSRMYEAALDIDYEALSSHQDRIVSALRGTDVRITDPRGTDLRMRVPRDAWFHENDGKLGPEKAARARSVRDLQMELPAGALRFIPDVDSVEGTLVAPSTYEPGTIRFRFRDGRIVSLSAEPDDHPFLDRYADHTGDKDRLAELVIGTNPELPEQGPGLGRWPPYYGYGDGILRIALGENWESGGENRSSMEAWFYLRETTITADGVEVVVDGDVAIPRPVSE